MAAGWSRVDSWAQCGSWAQPPIRSGPVLEWKGMEVQRQSQAQARGAAGQARDALADLGGKGPEAGTCYRPGVGVHWQSCGVGGGNCP